MKPKRATASRSAIANPWHRRLRQLLAAAVLGSVGLGTAAAQQIAITLDDGMDPRGDARMAGWNQQLLDALQAQRVRAMFFPAGFMVDSPQGMALVHDWSRAGHAVGNHTYSHQALSQGSPQVFLADVQRADALFAGLPGWCPRLRFPYLDEGATPALREAVLGWMAGHGYGVASATIAIDDWTYNERLLSQTGKGASPDVSAHRQAYLDRLWQEATQQRERWQQMLGREPAHVLLLHVNALNALLMPDILAMFKSRGWTFIDPVTALADPIYQRGLLREGQTVALPPPACR